MNLPNELQLENAPQWFRPWHIGGFSFADFQFGDKAPGDKHIALTTS